jgi:FkbM family methyltransferase
MLPRINIAQCEDANFLLFSTDDAISTTLRRTGKWEEHILKISEFILQGIETPLVIDVGANLGAYSIPLAKKIHSVGGQVIGFEPQRIVYYQLCGNLILNRLDNYFPIHSAVGEKTGSIEIPEINYANMTNIGGFSLEDKYNEIRGLSHSIKTLKKEVPLIALDDYYCDRNPSLIKIDVEGLELPVLMGAKNFLAKHKYPPFFFEVWSNEWFRDEANNLFSFISNMGYKIFKFGMDDYLAQHPENPIGVRFTTDEQGIITMEKYK